MNWTEYQNAAERTVPSSQGRSSRLSNFALGLCGEAGEAGELVKKHLFHGAELDVERLRKELGDVLWYVATLATTAGLQLEDVAAGNIEKLRARYPDGFTAAASAARMDEAAPQPAPKATDERPTWDLVIEAARRLYLLNGAPELRSAAGEKVIERMRARDRAGREKYGTPHQAGNGRDHHRDLLEEVLDGACYATAAAVIDDEALRSLYSYVQQQLLHCALLLEAGGSWRDVRRG
ncbi:nucleoside triphosphate pyrophosphohydrolase family protein [Vulgatibacter sp.]|uniref:nucleoside triphosphate pyrophosphohydrolase family protein n=1 Tax=Vulgatibacter sp. TaxID=1971226 RepID=UPI00356A7B31